MRCALARRRLEEASNGICEPRSSGFASSCREGTSEPLWSGDRLEETRNLTSRPASPCHTPLSSWFSNCVPAWRANHSVLLSSSSLPPCDVSPVFSPSARLRGASFQSARIEAPSSSAAAEPPPRQHAWLSPPLRCLQPRSRASSRASSSPSRGHAAASARRLASSNAQQTASRRSNSWRPQSPSGTSPRRATGRPCCLLTRFELPEARSAPRAAAVHLHSQPAPFLPSESEPFPLLLKPRSPFTRLAAPPACRAPSPAAAATLRELAAGGREPRSPATSNSKNPVQSDGSERQREDRRGERGDADSVTSKQRSQERRDVERDFEAERGNRATASVGTAEGKNPRSRQGIEGTAAITTWRSRFRAPDENDTFFPHRRADKGFQASLAQQPPSAAYSVHSQRMWPFRWPQPSPSSPAHCPPLLSSSARSPSGAAPPPPSATSSAPSGGIPPSSSHVSTSSLFDRRASRSSPSPSSSLPQPSSLRPPSPPRPSSLHSPANGPPRSASLSASSSSPPDSSSHCRVSATSFASPSLRSSSVSSCYLRPSLPLNSSSPAPESFLRCALRSSPARETGKDPRRAQAPHEPPACIWRTPRQRVPRSPVSFSEGDKTCDSVRQLSLQVADSTGDSLPRLARLFPSPNRLRAGLALSEPLKRETPSTSACKYQLPGERTELSPSPRFCLEKEKKRVEAPAAASREAHSSVRYYTPSLPTERRHADKREDAETPARAAGTVAEAERQWRALGTACGEKKRLELSPCSRFFQRARERERRKGEKSEKRGNEPTRQLLKIKPNTGIPTTAGGVEDLGSLLEPGISPGTRCREKEEAARTPDTRKGIGHKRAAGRGGDAPAIDQARRLERVSEIQNCSEKRRLLDGDWRGGWGRGRGESAWRLQPRLREVRAMKTDKREIDEELSPCSRYFTRTRQRSQNKDTRRDPEVACRETSTREEAAVDRRKRGSPLKAGNDERRRGAAFPQTCLTNRTDTPHSTIYPTTPAPSSSRVSIPGSPSFPPSPPSPLALPSSSYPSSASRVPARRSSAFPPPSSSPSASSSSSCRLESLELRSLVAHPVALLQASHKGEPRPASLRNSPHYFSSRSPPPPPSPWPSAPHASAREDAHVRNASVGAFPSPLPPSLLASPSPFALSCPSSPRSPPALSPLSPVSSLCPLSPSMSPLSPPRSAPLSLRLASAPSAFSPAILSQVSPSFSPFAACLRAERRCGPRAEGAAPTPWVGGLAVHGAAAEALSAQTGTARDALQGQKGGADTGWRELGACKGGRGEAAAPKDRPIRSQQTRENAEKDEACIHGRRGEEKDTGTDNTRRRSRSLSEGEALTPGRVEKKVSRRTENTKQKEDRESHNHRPAERQEKHERQRATGCLPRSEQRGQKHAEGERENEGGREEKRDIADDASEQRKTEEKRKEISEAEKTGECARATGPETGTAARETKGACLDERERGGRLLRRRSDRETSQETTIDDAQEKVKRDKVENEAKEEKCPASVLDWQAVACGSVEEEEKVASRRKLNWQRKKEPPTGFVALQRQEGGTGSSLKTAEKSHIDGVERDGGHGRGAREAAKGEQRQGLRRQISEGKEREGDAGHVCAQEKGHGPEADRCTAVNSANAASREEAFENSDGRPNSDKERPASRERESESDPSEAATERGDRQRYERATRGAGEKSDRRRDLREAEDARKEGVREKEEEGKAHEEASPLKQTTAISDVKESNHLGPSLGDLSAAEPNGSQSPAVAEKATEHERKKRQIQEENERGHEAARRADERKEKELNTGTEPGIHERGDGEGLQEDRVEGQPEEAEEAALEHGHERDGSRHVSKEGKERETAPEGRHIEAETNTEGICNLQQTEKAEVDPAQRGDADPDKERRGREEKQEKKHSEERPGHEMRAPGGDKTHSGRDELHYADPHEGEAERGGPVKRAARMSETADEADHDRRRNERDGGRQRASFNFSQLLEETDSELKGALHDIEAYVISLEPYASIRVGFPASPSSSPSPFLFPVASHSPPFLTLWPSPPAVAVPRPFEDCRVLEKTEKNAEKLEKEEQGKSDTTCRADPHSTTMEGVKGEKLFHLPRNLLDLPSLFVPCLPALSAPPCLQAAEECIEEQSKKPLANVLLQPGPYPSFSSFSTASRVPSSNLSRAVESLDTSRVPSRSPRPPSPPADSGRSNSSPAIPNSSYPLHSSSSPSGPSTGHVASTSFSSAPSLSRALSSQAALSLSSSSSCSASSSSASAFVSPSSSSSCSSSPSSSSFSASSSSSSSSSFPSSLPLAGCPQRPLPASPFFPSASAPVAAALCSTQVSSQGCRRRGLPPVPPRSCGLAQRPRKAPMAHSFRSLSASPSPSHGVALRLSSMHAAHARLPGASASQSALPFSPAAHAPSASGPPASSASPSSPSPPLVVSSSLLPSSSPSFPGSAFSACCDSSPNAASAARPSSSAAPLLVRQSAISSPRLHAPRSLHAESPVGSPPSLHSSAANTPEMHAEAPAPQRKASLPAAACPASRASSAASGASLCGAGMRHTSADLPSLLGTTPKPDFRVASRGHPRRPRALPVAISSSASSLPFAADSAASRPSPPPASSHFSSSSLCSGSVWSPPLQQRPPPSSQPKRQHPAAARQTPLSSASDTGRHSSSPLSSPPCSGSPLSRRPLSAAPSRSPQTRGAPPAASPSSAGLSCSPSPSFAHSSSSAHRDESSPSSSASPPRCPPSRSSSPSTPFSLRAGAVYVSGVALEELAAPCKFAPNSSERSKEERRSSRCLPHARTRYHGANPPPGGGASQGRASHSSQRLSRAITEAEERPQGDSVSPRQQKLHTSKPTLPPAQRAPTCAAARESEDERRRGRSGAAAKNDQGENGSRGEDRNRVGRREGTTGENEDRRGRLGERERTAAEEKSARRRGKAERLNRNGGARGRRAEKRRAKEGGKTHAHGEGKRRERQNRDAETSTAGGRVTRACTEPSSAVLQADSAAGGLRASFSPFPQLPRLHSLESPSLGANLEAAIQQQLATPEELSDMRVAPLHHPSASSLAPSSPRASCSASASCIHAEETCGGCLLHVREEGGREREEREQRTATRRRRHAERSYGRGSDSKWGGESEETDPTRLPSTSSHGCGRPSEGKKRRRKEEKSPKSYADFAAASTAFRGDDTPDREARDRQNSRLFSALVACARSLFLLPQEGIDRGEETPLQRPALTLRRAYDQSPERRCSLAAGGAFGLLPSSLTAFASLCRDAGVAETQKARQGLQRGEAESGVALKSDSREENREAERRRRRERQTESRKTKHPEKKESEGSEESQGETAETKSNLKQPRGGWDSWLRQKGNRDFSSSSSFSSASSLQSLELLEDDLEAPPAPCLPSFLPPVSPSSLDNSSPLRSSVTKALRSPSLHVSPAPSFQRARPLCGTAASLLRGGEGVGPLAARQPALAAKWEAAFSPPNPQEGPCPSSSLAPVSSPSIPCSSTSTRASPHSDALPPSLAFSAAPADRREAGEKSRRSTETAKQANFEFSNLLVPPSASPCFWSPREEALSLFFASPPPPLLPLSQGDSTGFRDSPPKRQGRGVPTDSRKPGNVQKRLHGRAQDSNARRAAHTEEGRQEEEDTQEKREIHGAKNSDSGLPRGGASGCKATGESEAGNVFERLFNYRKLKLHHPPSLRESKRQARWIEDERRRRQQETAECTFRPNISRSQRTVSGLRARATERIHCCLCCLSAEAEGRPSRRVVEEGEDEGRREASRKTDAKKGTRKEVSQQEDDKKRERREKGASNERSDRPSESCRERKSIGKRMRHKGEAERRSGSDTEAAASEERKRLSDLQEKESQRHETSDGGHRQRGNGRERAAHKEEKRSLRSTANGGRGDAHEVEDSREEEKKRPKLQSKREGVERDGQSPERSSSGAREPEGESVRSGFKGDGGRRDQEKKQLRGKTVEERKRRTRLETQGERQREAREGRRAAIFSASRSPRDVESPLQASKKKKSKRGRERETWKGVCSTAEEESKRASSSEDLTRISTRGHAERRRTFSSAHTPGPIELQEPPHCRRSTQQMSEKAAYNFSVDGGKSVSPLPRGKAAHKKEPAEHARRQEEEEQKEEVPCADKETEETRHHTELKKRVTSSSSERDDAEKESEKEMYASNRKKIGCVTEKACAHKRALANSQTEAVLSTEESWEAAEETAECGGNEGNNEQEARISADRHSSLSSPSSSSRGSGSDQPALASPPTSGGESDTRREETPGEEEKEGTPLAHRGGRAGTVSGARGPTGSATGEEAKREGEAEEGGQSRRNARNKGRAATTRSSASARENDVPRTQFAESGAARDATSRSLTSSPSPSFPSSPQSPPARRRHASSPAQRRPPFSSPSSSFSSLSSCVASSGASSRASSCRPCSALRGASSSPRRPPDSEGGCHTRSGSPWSSLSQESNSSEASEGLPRGEGEESKTFEKKNETSSCANRTSRLECEKNRQSERLQKSRAETSACAEKRRRPPGGGASDRVASALSSRCLGRDRSEEREPKESRAWRGGDTDFEDARQGAQERSEGNDCGPQEERCTMRKGEVGERRQETRLREKESTERDRGTEASAGARRVLTRSSTGVWSAAGKSKSKEEAGKDAAREALASSTEKRGADRTAASRSLRDVFRRSRNAAVRRSPDTHRAAGKLTNEPACETRCEKNPLHAARDSKRSFESRALCVAPPPSTKIPSAPASACGRCAGEARHPRARRIGRNLEIVPRESPGRGGASANSLWPPETPGGRGAKHAAEGGGEARRGHEQALQVAGPLSVRRMPARFSGSSWALSASSAFARESLRDLVLSQSEETGSREAGASRPTAGGRRLGLRGSGAHNARTLFLSRSSPSLGAAGRRAGPLEKSARTNEPHAEGGRGGIPLAAGNRRYPRRTVSCDSHLHHVSRGFALPPNSARKRDSGGPLGAGGGHEEEAGQRGEASPLALLTRCELRRGGSGLRTVSPSPPFTGVLRTAAADRDARWRLLLEDEGRGACFRRFCAHDEKTRLPLRRTEARGGEAERRGNDRRGNFVGLHDSHRKCKLREVFSFKPTLFRQRQSREPSASLLSLLRNVDTARLYCAQVAQLRHCAEEKRRLALELRELEALKECTFKPSLRPSSARFPASRTFLPSAASPRSPRSSLLAAEGSHDSALEAAQAQLRVSRSLLSSSARSHALSSSFCPASSAKPLVASASSSLGPLAFDSATSLSAPPPSLSSLSSVGSARSLQRSSSSEEFSSRPSESASPSAASAVSSSVARAAPASTAAALRTLGAASATSLSPSKDSEATRQGPEGKVRSLLTSGDRGTPTALPARTVSSASAISGSHAHACRQPSEQDACAERGNEPRDRGSHRAFADDGERQGSSAGGEAEGSRGKSVETLTAPLRPRPARAYSSLFRE
ncbi:hypothetical protein BESB_047320 [Besnoitia besnoiti]|uniref:Uncharacterized protein n=1 Tax=Besnoitia besnoiti TaxID=94643 RepID=A0A2A9MM06_BESBE|nr:hypothetical protein BESB_047320 [Besnoitia besnoiti]PFH36540.1 hypothetical protein BESB_047320 [Besnoitia besnoiti]